MKGLLTFILQLLCYCAALNGDHFFYSDHDDRHSKQDPQYGLAHLHSHLQPTDSMAKSLLHHPLQGILEPDNYDDYVESTRECQRICNEEALPLSLSSGRYPEYLGIEGPQDRNNPQTCIESDQWSFNILVIPEMVFQMVVPSVDLEKLAYRKESVATAWMWADVKFITPPLPAHFVKFVSAIFPVLLTITRTELYVVSC